MLDDRAPVINISEKKLTRKERTTLAQLRSGHCRLLGSYKSRISNDVSLDVFADCGKTQHDVKHLFNCTAHPTTMTPSDLWNRSVDAIQELNFIEAGILDLDGPDEKANNNNRTNIHHMLSASGEHTRRYPLLCILKTTMFCTWPSIHYVFFCLSVFLHALLQ